MKIKLSLILMIFSSLLIIYSCDTICVKASELDENISEQIQKIDFTEIEDFLSNIDDMPEGIDYLDIISKMTKGEYSVDYDSFYSYAINLIFNKATSYLPIFIGIIAISIFCGVMQNGRSNFNEEGVGNVVFWVCFISITLLISTVVIDLWITTKNTIENIAKINEIMSPIILSLMIASGGTVSASMYTPTVAFLSNGVINVITIIILPLVGVVGVFSIISNMTTTIKINKLTDFVCGIIKWVLGITITIFTIFLSVNGISSGSRDGISMKLAKYAISGSIPIVGGFIKDGFDVVVAGSILIKNAVGLSGIIILFILILSPLMNIISFSLLIKLVSGLVEPICDIRISNFCTSISKFMSYLSACLLSVGFMMFLTFVFMTMALGAFI